MAAFWRDVGKSVVAGLLLLAVTQAVVHWTSGGAAKLLRIVPWWVWPILGLGLVLTIVLIVRDRRERKTVRIIHHNFFNREPGEPPRIWLPEKKRRQWPWKRRAT